jgi:hypothetical protein
MSSINHPDLALDPFVIDDRGLWFDGKDDMAEIKGLRLHHSFTLDAWIRPHGDGTIFGAGNTVHAFEYRRVYQWAIEENKLFWGDLEYSDVFFADTEITNFYWTHVAVTATWRNETKTTDIALW